MIDHPTSWDGPERPTIADLELYGLSIRAINMLERHLKVLYLDQLERVDEEAIAGIPSWGVAMTAQLRLALGNWIQNRPVKTVQELVSFRGGHDDGE